MNAETLRSPVACQLEPPEVTLVDEFLGAARTLRRMHVAIPDDDIRIATKHAIRAYVAAKEVPRGRWVTQRENLELADAVALATRLASDFAEVGVLIATAAGGMIYWTTVDQIFNSAAIVGAVHLLAARPRGPVRADHD
jgi:hypothetical protein